MSYFVCPSFAVHCTPSELCHVQLYVHQLNLRRKSLTQGLSLKPKYEIHSGDPQLPSCGDPTYLK